jgi:bifunctional UDP-N-acetylglucosamine pyrophosphorylase/glucosamine-1-phosphate N-acetyltransferase
LRGDQGPAQRAGEGAVQAIVEHKDASPGAARAIREIYTGIMAAPTALIKRWVMALKNDNVQKEFYLTDVVAMAVAARCACGGHRRAQDETEVAGRQRCPVHSWPTWNAAFQRRAGRCSCMAQPACAWPTRPGFDVRGSLQCGADVEIDVSCLFEGQVQIADGARIGAHCVIRDATIGARAPSSTRSRTSKAPRVGAGALVGPFARLRLGAELGDEVHIGNFVEVKNSTLAEGRGAKANHLAYLGDATVGERGQLRCGQHHRQLRRRQQAPHRDRQRRARGQQLCTGSAVGKLGDGATIGGGSHHRQGRAGWAS